jgi:tetratricopeptide (TPR) repeat protein
MAERRRLPRLALGPGAAEERRRGERRALPRAMGRAATLSGAEATVLTLGAIALAEALVAAALLMGWVHGALLLHGPLCLALLLLRRHVPAPGGWLGAVLRMTLALLPALGPLAALAGLAAAACGPPRGLRLPEPPPAEDPLEARLAAIAAAPRVPDGLLVEALGDVLHWGTAPQKARAIDIAADALRPGGEALLRLALGDPDPAVRQRAEAARPAVERRLLARAEALRAAARAGRVEDRRTLARHLDRAAFSFLLDPARADACRAEAAGLWQAIAEAMPEDAEAQAALGRDLLALGDLPAARLALEAALARGVGSPAVLGWLAECLFRLRDHAAMDALVARWRPVLEEEAAGMGALAAPWRLWLSQATAPGWRTP